MRTEVEPEVGHAGGERAQLDDALAEEVVRLRAERRLDLRAQVPVLVPAQYEYRTEHTRTAPLLYCTSACAVLRSQVLTCEREREPGHLREARVCASQVRTVERVRFCSPGTSTRSELSKMLNDAPQRWQQARTKHGA